MARELSPAAKSAVLLTLLAALVFVAAFMPWGTINAFPQLGLPGAMSSRDAMGASGPAAALFAGMDFHATFTGWNGAIAPGGFQLPNWLVVLAAAIVATFAWLRAASIWIAPNAPHIALPLALVGYGILHCIVAICFLHDSYHSPLCIGPCITIAAFTAILGCVVRAYRAAEAAAPARAVVSGAH